MSQLGDQIGDQLGDQLGNQLEDQLAGSAWGPSWGTAGDQLGDHNISCVQYELTFDLANYCYSQVPNKRVYSLNYLMLSS